MHLSCLSIDFSRYNRTFRLCDNNLFLYITLACQGSGCRTAVEHTPHDRDVMDSNTARCWAFFLFSIQSEVCP